MSYDQKFVCTDIAGQNIWNKEIKQNWAKTENFEIYFCAIFMVIAKGIGLCQKDFLQNSKSKN